MALLGVQGYRSVDLNFVLNILNICQNMAKIAAANEHESYMAAYIYIYL